LNQKNINNEVSIELKLKFHAREVNLILLTKRKWVIAIILLLAKGFTWKLGGG